MTAPRLPADHLKSPSRLYRIAASSSAWSCPKLPQRCCYWEHFQNKSTAHNRTSQSLFPGEFNLRHSIRLHCSSGQNPPIILHSYKNHSPHNDLQVLMEMGPVASSPTTPVPATLAKNMLNTLLPLLFLECFPSTYSHGLLTHLFQVWAQMPFSQKRLSWPFYGTRIALQSHTPYPNLFLSIALTLSNTHYKTLFTMCIIFLISL